MTAFSDVFARKEMKYRLDSGQYDLLLAAVRSRLVPSEYGFSTVRSLYFDTPHYGLIEHSLDKPIYKEKLRLRVYGEPADDVQAFVEIKKKFKGVVYKRRVSMTLAAARMYLSGESYECACRAAPIFDQQAAAQSLSPRSIQVAREIDFFRERYESLAPSMLVVCDRWAYADPLGGELRITFDANIVADPEAKDLRGSCNPPLLLGPGEVIMEIKNAGPLPPWLASELSAHRAYPQSFSKYGTAYLSLLAAAREAKVSRGRHVRVNERSRTCA
ncbi:polyphosphate polymerase domain-containing protein [Raoultibacter massiliensis]|uniref:Polyphosphate polymerase domain-containing protein n=1 Tax=Raoultibacter massiliensis TaxID=1852371 RepID=A0ABV1JAC8_9ACTN